MDTDGEGEKDPKTDGALEIFKPPRQFTDYRTVSIEKEDTPRKKISFLRILVSLVFLIAAGGGSYFVINHQVNVDTAQKVTYYAPYVDVTNTPYFQFQDPLQNPAKQVVLGFIVSSGQSCIPAWGGYYNIAQASQTLSLDNRIFTYKNSGRNIVISFGGQRNQGLAINCKTTSALVDAYQSVISHYKINTLDFDIEGSALDNWASIQRRSAALATLQQKYAKEKKPLQIWLTLPVTADGLADNALSVVNSALAHKVDLAGINIMTMDYPASKLTLTQIAESSITHTETQLKATYRKYGLHLSAAEIYKRMGATPMIGQNDVAGEIFTLKDAANLIAFAKSHGLGRLSMWSLNRDISCGSSFTLLGIDSPTCSGIKQSPLQFSSIFTQLNGSINRSESTPIPAPVLIKPNQLQNNLPYPSWHQTAAYPQAYKVVREGNIYQAKYFNQGSDPAIPTQFGWQTPWQLLGPVLPSDHTPTVSTLPVGTYPEWSSTTAYQGGQKVLFNGQPYQAKWYNMGSSPLAGSDNPSLSPWQPLFALPGEPPNTGYL